MQANTVATTMKLVPCSCVLYFLTTFHQWNQSRSHVVQCTPKGTNLLITTNRKGSYLLAHRHGLSVELHPPPKHRLFFARVEEENFGNVCCDIDGITYYTTPITAAYRQPPSCEGCLPAVESAEGLCCVCRHPTATAQKNTIWTPPPLQTPPCQRSQYITTPTNPAYPPRCIGKGGAFWIRREKIWRDNQLWVVGVSNPTHNLSGKWWHNSGGCWYGGGSNRQKQLHLVYSMKR